jgi:3-oxosteroid 1-dehydrogenase
MTYLHAITQGTAHTDRLRAYVDYAPQMARFLASEGVLLESFAGYPDYFSDRPGAQNGRSLVAEEIDGTELGASFYTLRDQTFGFRLLDRYVVNLAQAMALTTRPRGWQWVAFKIIAKYWLDLPLRFKTRRDRRLTMGAALVGGLRRALNKHDVPVWLNTRLERILMKDGRVSGIQVNRNGRRFEIFARQAVIIALWGV